MKKPTQKNIVLKQLRATGVVSRNWCLQRNITRLSAIMLDLKKDGVNFEPKDVKTDFVYYLKDKPKEVIPYYVNGEEVHRKVIW